MEVKKTDGSFEEFIPEKIEKSICDAFSSVNDKCNEGLLRILTKNLFVYDKISTQEIRRQVEENLMSINKKAAKAYIQKYDDRKHLKKDEDFIKQYINASNASTGSKYDSNANVGNKNVVTLGQELHKGKNIQQNRYIMHNKIKALYSKKLADQYIKDLESHVLYKHDESGTPGYPYTYSSKEVVEVLYNGKNLLLPLDLLYQIVDEKEHLVDNENIVYQKVPWHLYVKDNEGKYTKITKLTKKKRHRPLVRVKTAFGEDLVVTDNHPMITDINDIENTVEAKDSLGCTQYRVGDKLSFKGNDKIDFKDLLPSWVEIDESFIKYQQATLKRYIDVNRKLGYVIGFFVGDGNFNNTSKTLVFTQGEKTVLEKLNNLIYDIFGITGKIQHSKGYNKEKYVLILSNLYVYELFRGYFKIQDKAQNKTLPYNILEFNEEFAKGCLEGLIDSDGTIKDNGSAISIRLASRACILQCTQLFRYFNYNVGNTKQSLPFGNNSSFKTNYTIWGISATKKVDSVLLNESEKVNKHLIDAKTNNLKYKNSGYVNITSVEEIEEESAFYDLNDFIYDITTETHTFSCNNILVHNCVAITMYPFLIDGLTKLGGQSTAPTDLKSYCGEFINLVYSISSQFMGACLYKDQVINFVENGVAKRYKIKDFVNKYLSGNITKFENYQGEWEYAKLPENIKVLEDGKLVDVLKVYRRKYNSDIYKISTKDGHVAYTSEDHVFKQLIQGRGLEIKAKQLEVNDTVFMNKDYSSLIDFTSNDFKKGWLIGMLCGDGCLTKENVVELSVNYEQEYLGDIFNEYSKEIYGYELSKNNGHNCLNYTKMNKDFKDSVMEDIIGNTTYDKHIDLSNKSLSYIAGWLDGMFCSDGSYSETHGITISLTNKELSDNIREAVTYFGLPYKNLTVVKPHGNKKESYQQYVSSRILKYLKHVHEKCLKRGRKNIQDASREVYYYGYNAFQGRHMSNKRMLVSCSKQDVKYNTDVIESIEVFKNDDDYVYEIETSSHWYNCGGFITHNCATPEFLMYMDYFIRKDYGDDYLNKLDVKVDLSRKERTLEEVIENCFQQVVHSMNMPAGNRGYQSVFWNVGYFDKNYFDGVFGDFVFPDGTKPKWETLSWLQKKFMKWFNEERTKYILTFPVETMAMLTDGHDIVDKEYADFTSEMWAEGHSFFCYLSDSPDSLSSCCFDKDQKVLWKSSTLGVKLTTLEELHNSKWGTDKKNLRIFHNGSWVRGKSIKLPNREMYKITTLNNKVFLMTDNHINLTLEGEKETKELTTNDYLMFNTQKLSAVPENDENLTYEQGFVVGAFLGDGSFGSVNKGVIYDINFSQNIEKYEETLKYINIANEQLGGESKCKLNEVYNNVYPLRISSRKLASFIMKWTLWERGTYAYNKKLNLNCLLQSEEFRRGILDGWYNTDGGNTNRCYTTSKELAEDMEVLITSLGMQSIINVSDKTEEPVIIRGEEYNRNYPLYCVKWYAESNNRANKDKEKAWIKKNNSIFFKVKSIEKVDYTEDVYCIECANEEEPYFTLPCGLITHNCRLRNSLKDSNLDDEHNHTTHQFSMGTASVATGSKSVMTINLNRVIQDATRKYAKEVENIEISDGAQFEVKKAVYKEKLYEYISNEITSLTERVHKYQRAFNEILKDFYNSNMLDVYSAGFISLKKQYLTVGVNGLTDAAEFLGLEANLNEEYNYFVNVILETINKSNKKDRTKECMYNTEFVPGENLSNKNYNWDKKDGYYVSPKHVMYSSYFFNPEDSSLSVLDKMKLHGENFVKYLDGGQAAHLNLNEHLSFNQYRELLKVASQNGCSYFTFNVKNSVCNDCGHISKDTLDTCPKCGSHNIDYLTRIIGYLSRVSSFAEARQVEEKMRYYS